MSGSGDQRGRQPGAVPPATERLHLADRLALRPKEAAEALGVSERTLRQMLPELPHVRVGGVVLLPVDALRGWLIEQAKTERGRAGAVAEEILQSVQDGAT